MVLNTKRNRTLSTPPGSVNRAKGTACLAVWLAVLCLPAYLAAQDTASRQDAAATIRVALSSDSIIGVNHNDALAAIKSWAKAILKNRGIDIEVDTRIIYRPEELAEALRDGQADAASMSTKEFLELKTKPEFIYLSTRKNSFTERYVLLVHRNRDVADVGDLRGRKLLLHNSMRMSLASTWVAAPLGLSEREAADITRIDNASRTVLPVFFRQADACVVTSSVFEIASELNPQLQKELRVLATSPEVVPALFFFRPGLTSHAKDELENAMLSLHESPAGQQVLILFQGDAIVKQPISCLESTRQLLLDKGVRSSHLGKGIPLMQKENTQ